MISRILIADSSALVSLASLTDSNHQKAIEISQQIKKEANQLLVSGEILSETLDVLGKKVNHAIAFATGLEVLRSNLFLIVETSEIIRIKALNMFKKQPFSVSFTDCLVMAFADEFETREIFGFDEAFRKNGYVRFGIDK